MPSIDRVLAAEYARGAQEAAAAAEAERADAVGAALLRSFASALEAASTGVASARHTNALHQASQLLRDVADAPPPEA